MSFYHVTLAASGELTMRLRTKVGAVVIESRKETSRLVLALNGEDRARLCALLHLLDAHEAGNGDPA